MGCPKDFSIKGGMGAALLRQPEKIQEILATLVQNVKIPVTCKIRILDSLEETLNLCKMIQNCGVSALAVHGRRKEERSHQNNHDDYIRAISKELKIPVIANGGSNDIKCYEDILSFKKRTNAAAIMIARAAQWNCSVFRRQGSLPLESVIKSYLKYVVDYDSLVGNAKYCIQSMLRDLQDSDVGKALLDCQTLESLCQIWSLDAYYRLKQEEFKCRLGKSGLYQPSRGIKLSEEPIYKRLKIVDGNEDSMKLAPVVFHRGEVKKAETLLPKSILYMWTQRKGLQQPLYQTKSIEKLFYSIVTVEGKIYGSSVGSKSKRYAEQAAAQVCIDALDLAPVKSGS
ncbi:hypothetical protein QYM36_014477 [Artemia franciscana]|nr:hypothetical protein QYM36_014477 [Artemia franciscana]